MRRINSALVTAAKNSDYEGVQVSTDTVDSWDAGISASIVFIDEVKDKDQYYQTTLLRELSSFAGTNNGPSIQSLNANGVAITVKSNSGNQAAMEVLQRNSRCPVRKALYGAKRRRLIGSACLSLLKNLSCTKTCPVWESVWR